MYIRMGIMMFVNLYTSRIILRELGVEDYGIYNVIGSIVVLFNSLRGVFASSTQRFLNFEMGKGNRENLCKVFNLSLQVNLLIVAIFLLFVEPTGLWFIHEQMNFDPSRFTAVQYVLQFSILSAVLSILSISFDAVVIANEKMSFYAYMSIIDALMRLGICYLIQLASDKLILYGFLMMFSTFIVLVANIIYCRTHFHEVRLRRIWDWPYLKEMAHFAGWNFFGNTAYALSNNGINMILNVFGGPVVNTARGITYQVNQSLSMITENIALVFRPFTIKTYAEGDEEKAMSVTFLTSKIYFYIQLLIVIVFSFFLKEILMIWLGIVPEYIEPFMVIILWYTLCRTLHIPIDILFYAVGNLKKFQLCEGVMLVLPVPISYLLLKNGLPYYTAFIAMLVIECINMVCICHIAKKVCKLHLPSYRKQVVWPCLVSFVLYALCYALMVTQYHEQLMARLLLVVPTVAFPTFAMYFWGLSKAEKDALQQMVKDFILKKRNK
jgi:O-antigen/teichoic acid export membrane protein